jgi:hypothetical protein
MFSKPTSLLFFLVLIVANGFSQSNNTKQQIVQHFENYFALERENMHLHLNKNTYLTNESIWFKGYVYNKKDKLPFFFTTNIYVALYDENGTKIETKLLYANAGCFSGNFVLGEHFKTGKYYIHVYTNWMNNFKEDESGKFELNIINNNDSQFYKEAPDYSKTKISFFPEGGTIIEGTLNTIGIKVADCNGKALPISKVNIVNYKGDTIQKVMLNKYGHGKFQLEGDTNIYKASFKIKGERIEQNLPIALKEGIALEISTYSLKDKTIAKVRTNKKGVEKFKTEALYLVVQQNNKSFIIDVNFSNDALEQTIIIPNTTLFEGLNTCRIIDSNKKQLAERYIFKYPEKTLSADIPFPSRKKSEISFEGTFSIQNTNASISILPENSLAVNLNDNLFASFLINPYFTRKKEHLNYYFTDVSKIKQFELDLLLLNQDDGKYKWENIIGDPPTSKHEFDVGFTIKGTINQTIKDVKKNKVQLNSFAAQINELAAVDDKKEFYFRNLVIADSTTVFLNLITNGQKPTLFKVYPQILNLNRTFNKSFTVEKSNCSVKDSIQYDFPGVNSKMVILDEVDIKIDKKKLKYKNNLGNGSLTGYKILDDDPSINLDLVDYLSYKGFIVERVQGQYVIYNRTGVALNGRTSPAVFVGGMQQISNDFLQNLKVRDIDEIYISNYAVSPTARNTVGIIKVYPKSSYLSSNPKATSVSFAIKNSFSRIEPFKNIDYKSTEDKGFQNFGVINWIPLLATQETNIFKFEIPDMQQKKVTLLIEGFSDDGTLISETRTISLP